MADDTQQYAYKKVKSLVFGVLSPKMIKQMASAKVVTPELYDKEGYPVDGGLMDTRLGVIDPGLKCRTCGSKLKECIGHFGYIELARPVIHLKYVNLIQVILKATCRECGKVMIPNEGHRHKRPSCADKMPALQVKAAEDNNREADNILREREAPQPDRDKDQAREGI
jgi:DNA-directed RNA polymerase subunit A'